MKQATNTYSLKKNNNIGLIKLLAAFFLIIAVSGYLFYQIIPKDNNMSFTLGQTQTNVYVLISNENEIYLNKINVSTDAYEEMVKTFKNKLLSVGIKSKIINEDEIKNLTKNDILIALDTYNISSETLNNIKEFLKKGGHFIFNYHFGYFFNQRFVKSKNIQDITNLKYLSESLSKSEANFYTPKILSPLIQGNNARRQDLVLYSTDTLPLFESDYMPDAVLTNWEITSNPILNNKMLSPKQSGVAWHGFYEKGSWYYFSFPGYVFLDMPKYLFKKYFSNIFSYFNNSFTVAKYPFLDSKNAVFISEDTEYKYTNMIHFSRLAKKYNIPVTLFCVADLALKNKRLTKEAALLPNVEIGSHSFTHTKIQGAPLEKVIKEIKGSKEVLEQITGKKIYGFRPPREEIDKTMENVLRDAGYKYVMEKTKPYLLPEQEYKHLITIPRHGTDDYIYLMNLDWNKTMILDKIIQETNMLCSLNAIYTLSVHTHLLSYKSNLSVSQKYFKYLTEHKNFHPFKGIEITDRIKLKQNINLYTQQLNNKTFLYINNQNDKEVKNFSLRIYWPNSNGVTIIPELSNVNIKILKYSHKRRFTDISIKTLKPKSKISLILEEKE